MVVLNFLLFLAFAFVLFETTVGLELCEEGFNPAELMADWKKEPG